MYHKFISTQYVWTRQMSGITGIPSALQADAKMVLAGALKWLDSCPASFLDYRRATAVILRNNKQKIGKLRIIMFDLALRTDLGPEHLEGLLREVLYIKRNGWEYYQRIKHRPFSK